MTFFIAVCDNFSRQLRLIAESDMEGWVHIISEKRIWEAKAQWPQTATALDAWYRLMKRSRPSDFAKLKVLFPAVDKVGPMHVFDIGGNKLRLIAVINYSSHTLFIKHILDHPQYDKARWKTNP